MKKISYKILLCIVILSIFFNICTSISFAANNNFSLSKYKNSANSNNTSLTEPVRSIAGVMVGVIRIIGTGVALIVLTIIGIKYVIAAPGDRADLKKSSVQYVVGAIIVFGSSQFLGILVNVLPKFL